MHACEFHLVSWIYVDIDQYGVDGGFSSGLLRFMYECVQARGEIKSPHITSNGYCNLSSASQYKLFLHKVYVCFLSTGLTGFTMWFVGQALHGTAALESYGETDGDAQC